MSKFQELSQAIGVAVHKEAKSKNKPHMNSTVLTLKILRDTGKQGQDEVFNAVKELVNHTIKNT